MPIKKILWPTDLSPNSARALPWVAELSERLAAEVHLLYVAEDVRRFDHIYGDANQRHLEGLQKIEVAEAEKKMERVCQGELDRCPGYKRHLAKGDPPREILRLAQKEQVDLIVMATHGKEQRPEEPAFFGGVTAKVVQNSSVPVLTINPSGSGVYPYSAPGVPAGIELD